MVFGYMLMEDVKMMDGCYVVENFDQYIIFGVKDVFDMKLIVIEELMEGDFYGLCGVGEIGMIVIILVIVKVVYDVVGCWINKLLILREEFFNVIDRKGMKEWM